MAGSTTCYMGSLTICRTWCFCRILERQPAHPCMAGSASSTTRRCRFAPTVHSFSCCSPVSGPASPEAGFLFLASQARVFLGSSGNILRRTMGYCPQIPTTNRMNREYHKGYSQELHRDMEALVFG